MLYASVNIANKKRIEALPRNCTVSIRDTEGVLHTVQVEGRRCSKPPRTLSPRFVSSSGLGEPWDRLRCCAWKSTLHP
jgi:hypothetical protein